MLNSYKFLQRLVYPPFLKFCHNFWSSLCVNFRTHLSGDNKVHTVETNATCQTVFQLNKNGMKLHYKLIVANIKNIKMAHIHMGSAEENGPVVVWLYPPAPPAKLIEGSTNGVLQEKVIPKDDLVGQLKGEDLWDLVKMMKDGQTYVNVHTDQYPAGEIRGQIMMNGRRNEN